MNRNGCLKHLWSMHEEIWIVRKCSTNKKTSKLRIVFSETIESLLLGGKTRSKIGPVGRGSSWLLLSGLHSNCTGRTSPWPFYGFWPWRASIHAAFSLVNLALSVQPLCRFIERARECSFRIHKKPVLSATLHCRNYAPLTFGASVVPVRWIVLSSKLKWPPLPCWRIN